MEHKELLKVQWDWQIGKTVGSQCIIKMCCVMPTVSSGTFVPAVIELSCTETYRTGVFLDALGETVPAHRKSMTPLTHSQCVVKSYGSRHD